MHSEVHKLLDFSEAAFIRKWHTKIKKKKNLILTKKNVKNMLKSTLKVVRIKGFLVKSHYFQNCMIYMYNTDSDPFLKRKMAQQSLTVLNILRKYLLVVMKVSSHLLI